MPLSRFVELYQTFFYLNTKPVRHDLEKNHRIKEIWSQGLRDVIVVAILLHALITSQQTVTAVQDSFAETDMKSQDSLHCLIAHQDGQERISKSSLKHQLATYKFDDITRKKCNQYRVSPKIDCEYKRIDKIAMTK
jgi:hypothetical protein